MVANAYNPDTAAALIGVAPSTVRNWCKTYGDQLSPAANPPLGKERRLTETDVATLQQVASMRAAGQNVEDIKHRLQSATVGTNAAQLTINVEPMVQTPTPAPTAQASPDGAMLLPVALGAINERITGIEQRLAAQAAESRTRAGMFALGVIAGIGIVLLLYLITAQLLVM